MHKHKDRQHTKNSHNKSQKGPQFVIGKKDVSFLFIIALLVYFVQISFELIDLNIKNKLIITLVSCYSLINK